MNKEYTILPHSIQVLSLWKHSQSACKHHGSSNITAKWYVWQEGRDFQTASQWFPTWNMRKHQANVCVHFQNKWVIFLPFPDDSSLCILQGKQQCVQHSPTQGMTNVCLSSVVSEPQLWTECPDTASLWQQRQKTLYSWLKGTLMAEPVAFLDRPLYIIQDHCCFKCH